MSRVLGQLAYAVVPDSPGTDAGLADSVNVTDVLDVVVIPTTLGVADISAMPGPT